MKDFHSCFGESGVQIADSSSSTTISNKPPAQNLVTCIYKYESLAISSFITVTWIKYLIGQGLSIEIESSKNESLCKFDIKPSLFSNRKGFKNLVVNTKKIDIYWDFSSAKFGSSPEPLKGFYLSVFINQEPCLLLGDLKNDAYKNRAIFIAKRENVFGKRIYSSLKAQFCDKGKLHDIRIEHDTNERCDQSLVIYVDNNVAMEVMHLKWNFRGNTIILVDGISVEVYWDVHSWLFGNLIDNAVFVFRTRVPVEGMCSNQSPFETSAMRRSKDLFSQGYGFSLVLCAWKNE
ncbi:hypothetical protein ACJIZ3_016756 [Penstemon smallii]|uniref:Uncharacterized protein n=1 Tax=Penstemon smallii TaxID=265156 RepID=A0ABD3STL9_9LAMI